MRIGSIINANNTSTPSSRAGTISRENEIAASKFFGKHVSPAKAAVLFLATTIMALIPMLIGLRFWDKIPELIITGITMADGRDDSLTRPVLVFGIPGLMALLNTICHGQLIYNQIRLTIPKTPVRICGRWSFPIISLFLVSGSVLHTAGEPYNAAFLLPCLISALMIIVGSVFFDCKRDSHIAYRFSFNRYNEYGWKMTHRAAGIGWIVSGLLILITLAVTGKTIFLELPLVLILLLFPIPFGKFCSARSRDMQIAAEAGSDDKND